MTTTAPAPTAVPTRTLTLMPHQQQTVDFIVNRSFAGVWLDMGGGKTLATLVALQYIRPMGHILVIAPVAIARSTWLDEIQDWRLPIRTRSLIVNDKDKKLPRAKRLAGYRQVFDDPPTMYFINQELVADLVEQMPVRTIDGQDTIIWPFQTVIIDESQAFKSHASNRFKALKLVRPAITRVIELTGTPAPNGLEDLWSQMYLLDQGEALGPTITAFRDRWFTPKMVPGTTTPAKWLPNPGAEEEIHQAISHLVMSARNTSLNLPDITVNDVHIRLTADLLEAYKDFKRELVIEVVNEAAVLQANQAYENWLRNSAEPEAKVIRDHLATLTGPDLQEAYERFRADRVSGFRADPDRQLVNTVIAENQAVLTSKLMQFASGTLYTGDPDEGTQGQYEVIHDAKIEMTEYLIRNNGGDPVLVAYHFRSDKEQLLARLNKGGIATEAFDGSREMIRRWNAKQIPVMLVHPASAGHGLNLQHGGHTLIWYTLPFSLEHYLQTNARLHRTGQTKPVTVHRLITKGTQDERMPVVLMTKKNTQDRLRAAVGIEQLLLAELEDEINDDLNELWATTRL